MRKNAALTAVVAERVPDGGWSVGGTPAPVAAHLEVKVTAGTNTAAEKAAFTAGANALLRSALGELLHDVTMSSCKSCRLTPGAWNGMTQGARAAAAREA